MQRRDFSKAIGAGTVVGLRWASPRRVLAAANRNCYSEDTVMRFKKDYSDVRGFMYEPSYAWTETEAWQNFDPEIIELELGRAKRYFPKMNAVRMCVSMEAFKRENRLPLPG